MGYLWKAIISLCVQSADRKLQAQVITMVGRPGYHAKMCALGDGENPTWNFCCLVGIFLKMKAMSYSNMVDSIWERGGIRH